jgi:hypothetical protein
MIQLMNNKLKRIMNRAVVVFNLRLYPGNFLEGLSKTTMDLSQDNQSPDEDMKPGPPEHEAGELSGSAGRSVSSPY